MSRPPSRLMPPAAKHKVSLLAYPVLAVLACGLVYLLFQHPFLVVGAILILLVATPIVSRHRHAQLVAIAASRPSNSGICAFARSFDLKNVDPWVVRAVYEEVAHYFREESVEMALSADDDLIKDLGIDPEDLDMDIAPKIADRTKRTFENYRANPFYSSTNTLRGLVLFFNAQPRVAQQIAAAGGDP